MKNVKNPQNLIIGINADATLDKFEDLTYGIRTIERYCRSCPLQPFINEVLQHFRDKDDEIHFMTAMKFVTSNGFKGKHNRKLLEKWLAKNIIEFNSIQYCSEKFSSRDKLLGCKKLHVDVMIDDKSEDAIYLAENGVKVILIDAPYNKDVIHNNIVRVNSWLEVKEEVDKLRCVDAKNAEFSKLNYQELDRLTDEKKEEYYKDYYRHLKKESLKLDEKDLIKGKRAYRLIFRILYPIIKLCYKPVVEQKENIPYQAGKIICSNHVRLSDYYLIYLGLGIEQYCAGFMAAEIKESLGGKFFKWMRSAAFIDRDDPESRKLTAEELAVRNVYGDNIIVFPEGTRKDKTEEGKKEIILPFHKGAVSMAKKTGTAMLPVAIYYGKRTRIKYGEMFYVEPTDDVSACTDKLQNIIKGMIEEMMRQDN